MAKEKKDTSSALTKALTAIQKQTGASPVSTKAISYGYVSTGSFNVDMLIGGAQAEGCPPGTLVCPGFPRRRITEVYGPESSGKTTLLISAMRQAQLAGGCAMFIDFEHALDIGYCRKQGLNTELPAFAHFQPETMEDGLKMVTVGIAAGVDIIGVDSIAAMVAETEMGKKMDEAAKVGGVALKLSQVLPKFVTWLNTYPKVDDKPDPNHPGTALVLLNQTRALIQIGGGMPSRGDNENTAGGKALKFFDFLRLRVSRISSEYIKTKDPLTGKDVSRAFGNVTNVKVVKNKLNGVQGHSTSIFLRYGTGIDDHYSVIAGATNKKLIKKDGPWLTLNGQRYQGKDKLREHLLKNSDEFASLKAELAKQLVASTDAVEPQEGDEIVSGIGDMDLGLAEDDDTDDVVTEE